MECVRFIGGVLGFEGSAFPLQNTTLHPIALLETNSKRPNPCYNHTMQQNAGTTHNKAPPKQTLLLMRGFSKSGKTTLARKIEKHFPDTFVRINSDSIHAFLNTTYTVFQDDNTVSGRAYELRDKATKAVQEALLKVLLQQGISVIYDACNNQKKKRAKYIRLAHRISPNIRVGIININIPEKDLIRRLEIADDESIASGGNRVWLDLYEKVQKPAFVEPAEAEADFVLSYVPVVSGTPNKLSAVDVEFLERLAGKLE